GKTQGETFLQGIARAGSPAEGNRGAGNRAAGPHGEDARARVLQAAAGRPARRPEAQRGNREAAAGEAGALGGARKIKLFLRLEAAALVFPLLGGRGLRFLGGWLG